MSVALSSTGSGLVTSSPSGITCGSDCSEDYLNNTVVTLVAKPTVAGDIFSGWSGAGCSGTGECKITLNTRKSVTANFSSGNISPSNNIFKTTRLFVMQQYRDFLNREGEEAGIEYWQKRIDDKDFTFAEVIHIFLNSDEFAGHVSPIVRLYFAYFLRIPDFDGLIYWLDAFKNGTPLASISSAF
jgi:hypothetical protein